ncbi:aspartate/glutamate racemase family protein [uncultured Roseovarius sp.]|uniref:aspartate/glutamate racemase family protein n=1 Tax=uncultured Roseovarius sp. TaxID=293344 RepID=UPI00261FA039|nr:aspartate/glutamate racemase family protein [uncultured Roseovarius sp.]
MIIKGGHSYQGYSVGILMFDNKLFPMPPGDVGNATSYPFPVLLRQIKGLEDNPYPPLTKADGSYTAEVQSCIDAAVQLERDGVRAIAMCCGFFSLIQPVLAKHVSIPVMTSPLMMLPVIQQMIHPDQKVLVVTAAAKLLTSEFFSAVGADLGHRIALAGLDDSKVFNAVCMGGTAISFEYDDLCKDVLNAIAGSREQDPDIGAVLLECTSLPPFANEVRSATGLPVFDFIACVEWLHRAVVPKRYSGYI